MIARNKGAFTGRYWRTIVACALIVWLAYGLRFSTFNMLAVSITNDLHITRSAFSLSISFRYLTAFLLSLAFGHLVDKLGIMKCLLIGLASTAAGEYIFSIGRSLPVFYAGGAVSGIGYALASSPAAVLFVNKRFITNRGLIMGTTSAVSGLGQALFNPVVGALALRWGWRSVYLCSTAIAIVVGLAIVLFLRVDEKNCVSGACMRDPDTTRNKAGLDISRVIKTPQFWALMLTGLFIGIAATGSYLIFPSHAQQDGFSLLFVTAVLGITVPVGNIVGKLVFGATTDKLGAGRAAIIPFGTNLIGVIAAIFMAPTLVPVAVIASLGIGFGISAPNLVPSLWVTELFGEKNSHSLLGFMTAFVMAGSAAAMPIANLLFEQSGSYTSALTLEAILIGAIVLMTLTILQKKIKA